MDAHGGKCWRVLPPTAMPTQGSAPEQHGDQHRDNTGINTGINTRATQGSTRRSAQEQTKDLCNTRSIIQYTVIELVLISIGRYHFQVPAIMFRTTTGIPVSACTAEYLSSCNCPFSVDADKIVFSSTFSPRISSTIIHSQPPCLCLPSYHPWQYSALRAKPQGPNILKACSPTLLEMIISSPWSEPSEILQILGTSSQSIVKILRLLTRALVT